MHYVHNSLMFSFVLLSCIYLIGNSLYSQSSFINFLLFVPHSALHLDPCYKYHFSLLELVFAFIVLYYSSRFDKV